MSVLFLRRALDLGGVNVSTTINGQFSVIDLGLGVSGVHNGERAERRAKARRRHFDTLEERSIITRACRERCGVILSQCG